MAKMENKRLKKAEKFLKDAKSLFSGKSFESCVSRSYYCLFHAALTLLEKFNVPAEARKHRYVLSAFPREFIHRRKYFGKDVSDFLNDLYDERRNADYTLEEFSEKRTGRLLDKAEKIYHSIFKVYERAENEKPGKRA